ncbi:MAG: PilZ domain-containing protein [Planctomycetes bacterium]|nr:PilZ domain-containing protein [Planctomycetota bacterium]
MSKAQFPQDREFTRVPVLMVTALTTDTNQVAEGHIHDLSARGVLFAGEPALAEGTLVAIQIFPAGKTEGVVLRARGKVERCTAFGLGVQFLEIEAESWDHLQNVIYLHAQDPDVVRHEFEQHHGLRRRRDAG